MDVITVKINLRRKDYTPQCAVCREEDGKAGPAGPDLCIMCCVCGARFHVDCSDGCPTIGCSRDKEKHAKAYRGRAYRGRADRRKCVYCPRYVNESLLPNVEICDFCGFFFVCLLLFYSRYFSLRNIRGRSAGKGVVVMVYTISDDEWNQRTWAYRLCKQTVKGQTRIALHEVYFLPNGKLVQWTAEPVSLQTWVERDKDALGDEKAQLAWLKEKITQAFERDIIDLDALESPP